MSEGSDGFVRRTASGKFRVDWRGVAPESYFTTARLVREIGARAKIASGRMLDIGCGKKPYQEMFASHVSSHIGVDMPQSLHGVRAIDAFSTADRLPFASDCFDFVLCTEVLEHVPDPRAVYSEIARVLRRGGRALITTPFMYRIHEPPYDFYRYTPFSHRLLAESEGLMVEEIAARGGYFSVLIDLHLKGLALAIGGFGAMLHRVIGRGRGLRTAPITKFLFSMIQRPFAVLYARERVKSDVYTLGYVVVVRKPAAAHDSK